MRRNAARAVALFLLLLLLSNAAAWPSCEIKRRTVAHCTDLRSFPPLSDQITELNILCSGRFRNQMGCARTRQVLPNIQAGWIQRFPRLESIRIENCPYRKFPTGVFSELNRLRTLVLFNLSLSRLSKDALVNSYNLEVLRLEHLPCMTIDSFLLVKQRELKEIVLTRTRLQGIVVRHLITSVKDSLAYFSWSKNMASVSLPIRTFSGFHKLNELDLSYNRLTDSMDFLDRTAARKLILEGNPTAYPQGTLDFSSYVHMRKMEHLNLRSMNLRSLPAGAFRPLVNLRSLLLGKNLLTFVSRPLIINMRHLMTLDLSENRLLSVPQEMEYLLQRKRNSQTFKLDLKGNPLHCNCEVAWLLKHMYENENYYEDLRCNTGVNPRLNHKKLSSVRLSDLRCKQPAAPQVQIELFGALKVNNPNQLFPSVHQGKMLIERTVKEDGSVELDAGQSLRLVCRSQGDPAPLMMWQIINGTSVQREAPRDRLDRFNEIEMRFSQRQLRFDRYVIVCWAITPDKTFNINVTILNLKPLEILPTKEPWRPPADDAVPNQPPVGNQPPHQRRHHPLNERRTRVRVRVGPPTRVPAAGRVPYLLSNRTNSPGYEPQGAEGAASATSAAARAVPGTLVVLTAVVTLAAQR